ncbi:DUF1028 domain-containing protein [Fulvimarina endophytica]|uniref:DUF1028 domain-containing protein n=1 Tax=Fulvimarina endophytica TaxID=2293836 RepID=A0A371XBE5_9HYPH|nr:DUF1028 domain-containing protein [Fulvimarina endophytica]RFC66511.1 DUF1028 domain-containing protein [Fulvimarina endophytica]
MRDGSAFANTYSIVARCARTGELGIAVASAVPAVGAICPYVRTGVGAVTTQSWVNPYLAIAILDDIAAGADAEGALGRALASDSEADLRQLGVVDASGRSASFTGADCTDWHGSLTGPGYAIQGNMLTGAPVLEAMKRAFDADMDKTLAERLMSCLTAAQSAGGDKRGKQSAAVLVHSHEAYALVDLRVDEDADPVGRLRALFEIARAQLAPFVAGMPKRDGGSSFPREVMDLLLLSPPERPKGGGSREP